MIAKLLRPENSPAGIELMALLSSDTVCSLTRPDSRVDGKARMLLLLRLMDTRFGQADDRLAGRVSMPRSVQSNSVEFRPHPHAPLALSMTKSIPALLRHVQPDDPFGFNAKYSELSH
jgi:hypothetical protein